MVREAHKNEKNRFEMLSLSDLFTSQISIKFRPKRNPTAFFKIFCPMIEKPSVVLSSPMALRQRRFCRRIWMI